MKKSEIRKHYFQEKYVIIAPKRAKRPHRSLTPTPANEVPCYFCPGTKERPIYEITDKNSHPWKIRVLNNGYPALTLDNKYAYGKQEIVVETPDHGKEIHELPVEHIKQVLDVYSERYESLSKIKKIRYVLVFKNEGGKAGASIPHSHSQIIALPMIPPQIQGEIHSIEKYFLEVGRCPYCDILKNERKSPRVAWEDKNLFVLAPYASESPYGLWFIPKRHLGTLHDMTNEEKTSLAKALKVLLSKIDELDLSYNYFFHNGVEGENHHMILKLAPRPNIWAGLELGTGIVINPIPPEDAAKFYRGK